MNDHVILSGGNNNILISCPHGVSQIRLGKYKVSEIGALATSLYLQEKLDCFLIAKTKNNNDDANFDEKSMYKDSLFDLIKKHKIKYVIDFHGLAEHRDCDISLGIHLGKNIETDQNLFDKLEKSLSSEFRVLVDKPFMAGLRTISGSAKNQFPNIWTIQIEINCGITNRKENHVKYIKLLNILENWLKAI